MPFSRTKAALVAALPVVAALALTPSTAAAATPAFPAHYAAPYLQISDGDAGDLAADMNATGNKFYTLAFLTPPLRLHPGVGGRRRRRRCLQAQITALQAAGGNVASPSAARKAVNWPRPAPRHVSLTAAYANVVNTYGVTGWTSTSKAACWRHRVERQRRDSALAALQAQNPNVQVDYTLAVDSNGLPSQELEPAAGREGQGRQGQRRQHHDDGLRRRPERAERRPVRGRATAAQLAGLYGISTAAAYNRLGLTPIAGRTTTTRTSPRPTPAPGELRGHQRRR